MLGADAVILDLEDSVIPEEKDAARFLVTNAIKSLNFGETEVMVRINPLSICGLEDLAVVLPAGSTDDYEGFPAQRPRAGRSSRGPRQELSMPPTITVEWMKGFGLFMVKAVLSGRWP